MEKNLIHEINAGLETAFINSTIDSNLAYRPQFITNDHKRGIKVLTHIENQLMHCDEFSISVAFINRSGFVELSETLRELERRGIKGRILTTDYLCFSDPYALDRLAALKNVELKMYHVDEAGVGFHTKGYLFKESGIYRIIIGSSNMTQTALSTNMEWNTQLVSTEQGEMAQSIVREFESLWSDEAAKPYDEFIETYRKKYSRKKQIDKLIREQQKIALQEDIIDYDAYKLKPNKMQEEFICSVHDLIERGAKKALLISATGTGKTYASAFAMRNEKPKKALFIVHRELIARQALESYKKVFGNSKKLAFLSGKPKEYDADILFATMSKMAKPETLESYKPEEFDWICIDEVHRAGAESYQRIMKYFQPQFWLGMTASPERTDGFDIFNLFDHNIAYEIRLQHALKEDLLCPFHYFGITDIEIDGQTVDYKTDLRNFSYLVSDVRVRYILEQANYFGYSGERVKGLIFCRGKDEARELSTKFNECGYYTSVLTGAASEKEREQAINLLTKEISEDEIEKHEKNICNHVKNDTDEMPFLDYIFTIDIFNEGVDIPEINQVLMLRPTESPIIFVQQLGRGLRKAEGKEYVVIIDFIGNYTNNYMIPIALSGDCSYNADTIRKYVISGSSTIPGASTVHFDEIAKEKIFTSIDRMKGIKSIIRKSYITLKDRLGRVPYLLDFYENEEVDPLVIIREYKIYQNLLEYMEKDDYIGKIAEDERVLLEYLSKTILGGIRPYELEILKAFLQKESISVDDLQREIGRKYNCEMNQKSLKNAVEVLQGRFVSKEEELKKYNHISICEEQTNRMLHRMHVFTNKLKHIEFQKQIRDIVEVGLRRYKNKYDIDNANHAPFVLYEKYSRRDVSFLMNCGRDLSSTMYGMKKIGDDVFIFVTYHKVESADSLKNYVDGKPDYADAFEDKMYFRWDSQIGTGIESSYVKDVTQTLRKHLFVKKSDAETNFYYMGQFDIVNVRPARKKDNNGKERDITKFEMKMRQPVRDDLLRYLESSI